MCCAADRLVTPWLKLREAISAGPVSLAEPHEGHQKLVTVFFGAVADNVRR
jgi:hypothetical protein